MENSRGHRRLFRIQHEGNHFWKHPESFKPAGWTNMQLLMCLVESMRECEAENTKTVKFVQKVLHPASRVAADAIKKY